MAAKREAAGAMRSTAEKVTFESSEQSENGCGIRFQVTRWHSTSCPVLPTQPGLVSRPAKCDQHSAAFGLPSESVRPAASCLLWSHPGVRKGDSKILKVADETACKTACIRGLESTCWLESWASKVALMLQELSPLLSVHGVHG